MALCNSIKKLHAVDVAASTIYEEYLNVVKSYGAKDLTDRRITDYDDQVFGLTIFCFPVLILFTAILLSLGF